MCAGNVKTSFILGKYHKPSKVFLTDTISIHS